MLRKPNKPPLSQELQQFVVVQTRSIGIVRVHELQTGAAALQAEVPHAAFAEVVAPVANTVQRAIAVNVVFILVLLSVKSLKYYFYYDLFSIT